MICPNCGSDMSDKRTTCERCGMDLTLYKKILRASNLYYNDGLSRARVRDLSGAIISLKNCLKLNKLHTNARNLLGLIYFEMGETVAALSEWVISKHFQTEKNDADEYISSVQSNPTRLDILSQAIKRYNNALTSAKQGSDDLAIIQLKKVISLNTNFIRAYQLLSLLYMKNGEVERAKKYLVRAGRIDVSNITTLKYMMELDKFNEGIGESNGLSEGEGGLSSSIKPITSYTEDKSNIMLYVNLIIGVMIGIAIMAFVVFPSLDKGKDNSNNNSFVDLAASQARINDLEDDNLALQQDNEDLESDVQQLKNQIDSIVIPEVNSNMYDELFSATQLYVSEVVKDENQRDMINLALELEEISTEFFETEEAIALLNKMKQSVYPIASDEHYESGRGYYREDEFAQALIEFEKAFIYSPASVDVIYYIGRCYHHMDDYEKAELYYDIVIKDFPDTKRYDQATNYLSYIQN